MGLFLVFLLQKPLILTTINDKFINYTLLPTIKELNYSLPNRQMTEDIKSLLTRNDCAILQVMLDDRWRKDLEKYYTYSEIRKDKDMAKMFAKNIDENRDVYNKIDKMFPGREDKDRGENL